MALFRQLSDANSEKFSALAVLDFIRASDIPKGSAMFDVEAFIPFSSSAWGYRPQGQPFPNAASFAAAPATSNTWKVTLTGDFNRESKHLITAPHQDLLIISKKRGNLEYIPNLLKSGMYPIFQNDSFAVLSRNKPPIQPSFSADSLWSGDNRQPEHPGFKLTWEKNIWQGVTYFWPTFVDFRDVKQILIKFTAIPSKDTKKPIEILRFGFSGIRENFQNESTNIWHIDLKRHVTPGLNVIALSPSEFYASTGKVAWGYTKGMLFGGVAEGWTIKFVGIEIKR